MAAKGTILKQDIAKKILETFPNSFLYNDGKEIRINGIEDGVELQIKCVLTCAKTPVGNDNVFENNLNSTTEDINISNTNEKIPQEPSTEEKERLKTLLDKLGL